MSVNIQDALLNASSLSELTDRQLIDFRNRLDFIASIKTRFEKNVHAESSTQKVLDDLELDVVINLAAPSEDQRELSAYLTHTSWRMDVGDDALTDLLQNEVKEEIFRAACVPIDTASFLETTRQELNTLDKLIAAIETASEFDGFMAVLFAIDCTLARLLHFCYTARLLSYAK